MAKTPKKSAKVDKPKDKKGTKKEDKTTKPTKTKAKKTTTKRTKKRTPIRRTPVKRKGQNVTQPAPPGTIDELLKRVDGRYGSNIILSRASQIQYPFHIRRPTGVPRLDVGLAGGWPAGSINQVFGPEGVGKNALCYHSGGEVQNNYGDESRILLAGLGYGVDRIFARRSGLRIAWSDYEVQHLVEEAEAHGAEVTDEEIADLQWEPGEVHIIESGEGSIADTAPNEAVLQTVLDAIRTGLFQLIVVDEAVGAAATMDRVIKPLGEAAQTADNARLLTDFMKKFWYAIKTRPGGQPNYTTVIFASQTRMKIAMGGGRKKSWGGPDFERTGGQALKHGLAMDLDLKPGKWVRSEGETGDHVGKTIHWFLSKAKLGTHEGARGSYNIRFDMEGMIDVGLDLAEFAAEHEVLQRRGPVYDLLGPDGKVAYEGIRGGKDGAAALLRHKPDVYDAVYESVKRKIRANWRVR